MSTNSYRVKVPAFVHVYDDGAVEISFNLSELHDLIHDDEDAAERLLCAERKNDEETIRMSVAQRGNPFHAVRIA